MCEKCDNITDFKYCPYCGEELKKKKKKEITQEKFDEIFLDMLKSYNKIVWLDEYCGVSVIPTCRFQLRKSNDECIFDINLDPNDSHFWFSYDRVLSIFKNDYCLEYHDIQRLMKHQMGKLFKMNDVTPCMDRLLSGLKWTIYSKRVTPLSKSMRK